MTMNDDGPAGRTLEDIVAKVDGLQDLFRRRLLDDRNSQQLIRGLQDRIGELESERAGRSLRTFLTAISLLSERLDAESQRLGGDAFLTSLLDELMVAIGELDIEPIDELEPFDPQRHQVVAARGEGSSLELEHIIRPGFGRRGLVIVPALVEVRRVSADGSLQSGGTYGV